METTGPGWFTVRCVFRWGIRSKGRKVYEERITMWQAASFDDAVALAEEEAASYGKKIGARYLWIAQAYAMGAPPAHGAEVFSLLRASTLKSRRYVDRFFDTGRERQQQSQ